MSAREQLYSRTTGTITPIRNTQYVQTTPSIPVVAPLPMGDYIEETVKYAGPKLGPSIYSADPIPDMEEETVKIQQIHKSPVKIGYGDTTYDEPVIVTRGVSQYRVPTRQTNLPVPEKTTTIITKTGTDNVLRTEQEIRSFNHDNRIAGVRKTEIPVTSGISVMPRSSVVPRTSAMPRSHVMSRKSETSMNPRNSETSRCATPRYEDEVDIIQIPDDYSSFENLNTTNRHFRNQQDSQYREYRDIQQQLEEALRRHTELQAQYDDFVAKVQLLTNIKPPHRKYELASAGNRLITLTFRYPDGHKIQHSFDNREILATIIDTIRYDLKSLDDLKLEVSRGALTCGMNDSTLNCGIVDGDIITVSYITDAMHRNSSINNNVITETISSTYNY